MSNTCETALRLATLHPCRQLNVRSVLGHGAGLPEIRACNESMEACRMPREEAEQLSVDRRVHEMEAAFRNAVKHCSQDLVAR
jgi:hypothetical protein